MIATSVAAGLHVYVVLRRIDTGQFIFPNDGTAENFNSAHWLQYAFGAGVTDVFGFYSVAWPVALTAPGDYLIYFFQRIGLNPAWTDAVADRQKVFYNGTRDFVQPSPSGALPGLCSVYIQLPPLDSNTTATASLQVTGLPDAVSGAQLTKAPQNAVYDADSYQLVFPEGVVQGAQIFVICEAIGVPGNYFTVPADEDTYAIVKAQPQ